MKATDRPAALREHDEEIIRVCYPFPITPTDPRSAELLDFKRHLEVAIDRLHSIGDVFDAASAMSLPPLYFARSGILKNAREETVGILQDLIYSRTHISIARSLSLWEAHLSEEGMRRVAENDSATLIFSPQSLQRRDPKVIQLAPGRTDTEYNLEVHTAQLIYALAPMDYSLRILPNTIASGLCNAKFLQDALPHVRAAISRWSNPYGRQEMAWMAHQWNVRMDEFIQAAMAFENSETG